jgi:putative sterol carrier protein
MSERARPPEDIAPGEFFTRWIVNAVNTDEDRRNRLGDTKAVIEFELTGEQGGYFTVHIADGKVAGQVGPSERADLRVSVDIATWRALNRGDISAPEALLRRRVRTTGSFLLGLKLHLILG